MNGITYDFLNPILSDVMGSYYGFSPSIVGWLFFLMGIGYVISCQFTNFTLSKLQNRRTTVLFMALNGLSIMYVGPSNLLSTHLNLYFTLMGLFASGVCSAHFLVPVFSEILDAGENELGIDEGSINDFASGLSTSSYFLGQMIGYL